MRHHDRGPNGQAAGPGLNELRAAESIRIGTLARLAGVSVETIRYYEARGLISTAARRPSGYREFAADTVHQVRFIGRAQSLGFSLSEIRELALLRERAWAGDATAQLRDAVSTKLRGIDARLGELQSLRNELGALMAACDAACAPDAAPSTDCPLVEALDDPRRPAAASADHRSAPIVSVGPSTPGRRPGRQRRVPASPVSESRRRVR